MSASRRFATVLALVAATGAARLPAQDSQFGIRSPGTPGRWESVRSRSTGGAFALFDALSPLAEVALLDLRQLTASAAGATSFRTAEVAGTSASLRSSRFPVMSLSGPIGPRVALSAGFTTYLDRSFRTTLRDSLLLRGVQQPFTDEVTNDGAVTDLRFAAAYRVRRGLAFGGALHLLEGSAKGTATRHFDDSTTYSPANEQQEVRYDGFGVSFSAAADVNRDVRVVAWYRADSRLRTTLNDVAVDRIDLPTGLGAGVRWLASPSVRVAGSVARRSWSDAAVTGAPYGAHDTFNWAIGDELGQAQLPLRLGIRGGQMPFAPAGATAAPTETGFSLGTSRGFSQGRARIDFGLERLSRNGGGLQEHVWTVLLGFTVQP